MPIMTRSATRRAEAEKAAQLECQRAIERQRAIDNVKSLLVTSENTNNMQQRCAIMNGPFYYIMRNPYR